MSQPNLPKSPNQPIPRPTPALNLPVLSLDLARSIWPVRSDSRGAGVEPLGKGRRLLVVYDVGLGRVIKAEHPQRFTTPGGLEALPRARHLLQFTVTRDPGWDGDGIKTLAGNWENICEKAAMRFETLVYIDNDRATDGLGPQHLCPQTLIKKAREDGMAPYRVFDIIWGKEVPFKYCTVYHGYMLAKLVAEAIAESLDRVLATKSTEQSGIPRPDGQIDDPEVLPSAWSDVPCAAARPYAHPGMYMVTAWRCRGQAARLAREQLVRGLCDGTR